MEQRDAIVKNLREISHFFLSDNKQASVPNPEQKQEEQSSLAQTLPRQEESKEKKLSPKPVVSKAFFAASDNLPKIYHIIHNGDNNAVLFWSIAIAYELIKKGHKTCVIGDKKGIAKIVD
ncbi:hypothetical protein J7L67_02160, partial [bacterium]|nr:hypothetical protein [bacterium]